MHQTLYRCSIPVTNKVARPALFSPRRGRIYASIDPCTCRDIGNPLGVHILAVESDTRQLPSLLLRMQCSVPSDKCATRFLARRFDIHDALRRSASNRSSCVGKFGSDAAVLYRFNIPASNNAVPPAAKRGWLLSGAFCYSISGASSCLRPRSSDRTS